MDRTPSMTLAAQNKVSRRPGPGSEGTSGCGCHVSPHTPPKTIWKRFASLSSSDEHCSVGKTVVLTFPSTGSTWFHRYYFLLFLHFSSYFIARYFLHPGLWLIEPDHGKLDGGIAATRDSCCLWIRTDDAERCWILWHGGNYWLLMHQRPKRKKGLKLWTRR